MHICSPIPCTRATHQKSPLRGGGTVHIKPSMHISDISKLTGCPAGVLRSFFSFSIFPLPNPAHLHQLLPRSLIQVCLHLQDFFLGAGKQKKELDAEAMFYLQASICLSLCVCIGTYLS
jgi:hypothetical protein